jgi:hypothetical protein
MIKMVELEYNSNVYIIPEFMDLNEETVKTKYKGDIHDAVYVAINLLDEEIQSIVPCFIANDMVFEISFSDIDDHINSCIDHYTKTEEYEKCSNLTKLKNK